MAPDHGHHFSGAKACGIDDDLGGDFAFVCGDQPFAIGLLRQRSDAGVAAYGAAQKPCFARQGLRQLRGVDIAIERVPQRALQVVGFNQRVAVFEVRGRENFVFQAIGLGHAFDMVELVHAIASMGQAHRTGQVVINGVFGRRGQFAVQRCRILLQLQNAPATGKRGQIARRVPGGARGEFVALQQQSVFHT